MQDFYCAEDEYFGGYVPRKTFELVPKKVELKWAMDGTFKLAVDDIELDKMPINGINFSFDYGIPLLTVQALMEKKDINPTVYARVPYKGDAIDRADVFRKNAPLQ